MPKDSPNILLVVDKYPKKIDSLVQTRLRGFVDGLAAPENPRTNSAGKVSGTSLPACQRWNEFWQSSERSFFYAVDEAKTLYQNPHPASTSTPTTDQVNSNN